MIEIRKVGSSAFLIISGVAGTNSATAIDSADWMRGGLALTCEVYFEVETRKVAHARGKMKEYILNLIPLAR